MGNRGGVGDGKDLETGNAEGADGALTAWASTFDFDINLTETLIEGALTSRFAS